MKLLWTIILVVTILVVKSSADEPYVWEYTKDEHENLSKEQKKVLQVALSVGKKYKLSTTLAILAGVETRFGKYKAKNGRYCGPMQIDRLQYKVSCKRLREDIHLSMELAAKHVRRYLDRYNGNIEYMLVAYNGGSAFNNPHENEFLRRVASVHKVLKTHRKHT